MKGSNCRTISLIIWSVSPYPASLELSILAHMRSVSIGSSRGLVELTCSIRLSQGAPVSVAKPSMARPACSAKYEPCSFARAFSISATHSCLRWACPGEKHQYKPLAGSQATSREVTSAVKHLIVQKYNLELTIYTTLW